MMLLLIRRISSYTAPDILLGVFTSLEDLKAAKSRYIAPYLDDPESDPWKDQGYKERVPIDQDLAVEELAGEFSNGSDVFVVSDYREGFGQIRRTFDSLHSTLEAAEHRMTGLDSIREEGDVFPHYARLDWVHAGVLHSDAREDQPFLL